MGGDVETVGACLFMARATSNTGTGFVTAGVEGRPCKVVEWRE